MTRPHIVIFTDELLALGAMQQATKMPGGALLYGLAHLRAWCSEHNTDRATRAQVADFFGGFEAVVDVLARHRIVEQAEDGMVIVAGATSPADDHLEGQRRAWREKKRRQRAEQRGPA